MGAEDTITFYLCFFLSKLDALEKKSNTNKANDIQPLTLRPSTCTSFCITE